MTIEIKTKRQAAEHFVRGMNVYDIDIIYALLEQADYEGWYEVTAPTVGDRIYDYSDGTEGEIEAYLPDEDKFLVSFPFGHEIEMEKGEFEILNDGFLPMYGTMWSFKDPIDIYWLEERDGIRLMSECGFRIYKSEEFGYFFGIDGCGYDFYKSHWIPLYEARGLHWHEEED